MKPYKINQVDYYLYPIHTLLSNHKRWRAQLKLLNLSKEAKTRLEWFIYYESKANYNASLTARHFGIAPKTFYKWKNLFDGKDLTTLESRSRAPHHVRQREITAVEEMRIIDLRRQYMYWGKMKLAKVYERKYGTSISSWKVQRVIETFKLYPNPKRNKRIQAKKRRTRAKPKQKTINLNKKKVSGYLVALDTVVIYWKGKKRYILTAIDEVSKIAFARMYTTKHSRNAGDFLKRVAYLLDYEMWNVCHDNGSEFGDLFQVAVKELGLGDYWSRPATPKDNPFNERFNRTLQDEFVNLGNMTNDVIKFNRNLTEWLVEYNFVRPHQSLDYDTPWEYYSNTVGLLPMWSSSTFCLLL